MIFFSGSEARAISPQAFITGADMTFGSSTKSGARVSFDTVLGLDAVAAAVGIFCDIVSMLPVDVFRDRDGVPEEVPAPALVNAPSLVVDPLTWRAQVMVSWLIWGNLYGLILERDGLGFPQTVEILDPASVSASQVSSLAPVEFEVDGRPIDRNSILHVPGRYVRPGSAIGIAPLERFKETYGLAIAARDFGAQWFGGGAHPTGILSTEQAVDQEQANTIKERFMKAIKGKREPAVLGAGMTYKPIQTDPEKSQLTETQQAAIAMIARTFGLPPELLGAAMSGSSVTYANREQRMLDALTFSFDPWLLRIESMWSRNMRTPDYAKFNRSALLRTDTKTRYEAHGMALRDGWRNRNEIRLLEDEGRIPGGDLYFMPSGRALAPTGEPSLATEATSTDAETARSVAELVQKIYLGVGVVLTDEEARAIANRAGADLAPGGLPAAPVPPSEEAT